MKTTALILLALVTMVQTMAQTVAQASATDFLEDFSADPAARMRMLPRQIVDGQPVERGEVPTAEMLKNSFPKTRTREWVIGSSQDKLHGVSAITQMDNPRALIDGPIITNLADIHNRRLLEGSAEHIPWADYYWPNYTGQIGYRYSDPNFPKSRSAEANYNYVRQYSAEAFVRAGRQNQLSPAEKYDLLVGDTNMTLTRSVWQTVVNQERSEGKIPAWYGLCDGWAAAAHMGSPLNMAPVTVQSPSGLPITFYQTDIKALSALLWRSDRKLQTKFAGVKCTPQYAQKDVNGRFIHSQCLDSNPATFHLILTNLTGLQRRSFVVDSSNDAEIWNYSVAKYKFTYFNPGRMTHEDDPNKALHGINTQSVNPRINIVRPHRAANARYIIGINMQLSLVPATRPDTNSYPLKATPLKTYEYVYDLELDEKFNIVGGEWYTHGYPDFLWTYAPGTQATAPGDARIRESDWNTSQPFPASWTPVAQESSQNQRSSGAAPLNTVLRKIVGAR